MASQKTVVVAGDVTVDWQVIRQRDPRRSGLDLMF